jgi:TetR/AcrR family transcriptional regulator, regulator of autoinduction and epiphytic fitness
MVALITPVEPRRLSLKEQQQRLREDVILQAVNGLLAEKGFDLMTVDEVAAVVGIAKASLYKHFESKEMLAAAAMVRLLDRTLEVIKAQPEPAAPIGKLKAVVRWAVREHLAGQMPSLPPEVVLYTLYARACDPVSDYLKLSGNFRDEEIVELVTATCFDGLAARPS